MVNIYPNNRFVSNNLTELERVAHTACVLIGEFYQKNGLVVLPDILPKNNEAQIVFPDLDYRSIPYFWDRIKNAIPQFPFEIQSDIKKEIEKMLIGKNGEISQDLLVKWQAGWNKIKKHFYDEMLRLFPDEFGSIGNIEVRLTRYGSIASYSYLSRCRHNQTLIIYVRIDGDLSDLASSIIGALLCPDRDNQGFHWNQREAIVDFLMSRDFFANIFPRYKPTLAGIIHIPKKYKEKSDSYLKSLGSLQGRKIYLIDGSLYIGDRCVEAMLGKEEKRVLELIINRKNEVVDVDMIADLLWGEGETKSFWAITKLMQRIRKKVEEWSGGKIKLITLRGRGYFLEE